MIPPMNHRLLPYLAIAVTAFGWALSPVFMRYMSASYDPLTQAFIRYCSAMVVLVPFSAYFYGAELRRLLSQPRNLIGLALLAVLMQTLWTYSLYLTTATTAVLITKLQVAFVIVLSFVLFREERAVIRSPGYLFGTLLGVTGVILFVQADSQASLMPQHHLAVLVLIVVSLCWAAYAVWGKHLVMNTHSVPMFTVVSLFATLGFLVLMSAAGNPASLIAAGPRVALIAFVSGVFSLGIAHCTFHYAQKHLGSAFSSSITLLSPLITHVFARLLWADELLATIQWIGGASLIAGSYLVVQAQRKRGQDPTRDETPPPE